MVTKKYKLIKCYPGSPKLGTEVNYSESMGIYNYNGGNYFTELPKHQVENLPEFWEEVKEKEYEILSMKNKGGDIYYVKPDEDLIYELKYHTIHSIKRLSDGEVFTLGDTVQLKLHNGKYWNSTNCIIERIQINSNKNDVDFLIRQEEQESIYKQGINFWKKAKLPLFTTEDGVDIFKYDKFYFVAEANWAIGELIANNNVTACMAKAKFNSKEAAEKWVDENKPKYSKRDVEGIVAKSSNGSIQGNVLLVDYNYLKFYLDNDKTR